MNRAVDLAHPLIAATRRIGSLDAARRLIVLGCALALILAGAPLPL